MSHACQTILFVPEQSLQQHELFVMWMAECAVSLPGRLCVVCFMQTILPVHWHPAKKKKLALSGVVLGWRGVQRTIKGGSMSSGACTMSTVLPNKPSGVLVMPHRISWALGLDTLNAHQPGLLSWRKVPCKLFSVRQACS